MGYIHSKIVFVLLLGFAFIVPIAAFAATSPSLGASSTYAITSSTYTNSLNAALETAITGDICYTTGPGTTPVSISGATVVPCAPARGTDQSSALTNLNGQSCTNLGVNVVLSGTFTPGCYFSTGTMDITLSTTVTLNGSGTYIFRSGGALTTGTNSVVALSGGASACNVFWAPGGATTIGANSSTSATPTFVGNILQNSLASFDVTIGHFVNLSGRILAFGRTVTTDSNTITVPTGCAPSPATLHVIKHVINDNGGSAVAGAFTLNVTGTNVSNPSFVGSEAGTDVTLDAGSYTVTEPVVPTGYLQTGSGNCSGTILAGETKTCTITNDDIAPQLIVNKIVINDNGRTKVISDFPLFIDSGGVTSGVATTTTIGLHTISETSDSGYTSVIGGDCAANGTITLVLGDVKTCTITNNDIAISSSISGGGSSFSSPPIPPLIDVVKVPNPLALPNGPGPVIYTYTLHNIGTIPVANVTMVDDTCSPIVFVSGDANNNAKLDLNEIWVYHCATILSKTHTNVVTATGFANGISAVDTASATVVVGISIVPPLIHVTKIPSPLSLSTGGGMVTYTNKVTNLTTVPLSNVRLIDDKCNPVNFISGDTNNNLKLDVNETWVYTCKMNLNETTTNTVTASGDANGLTATDFAIATVIVSGPGLPKTGYAPEDKSSLDNIILIAGVFGLVSFYVARKKQTI